MKLSSIYVSMIIYYLCILLLISIIKGKLRKYINYVIWKCRKRKKWKSLLWFFIVDYGAVESYDKVSCVYYYWLKYLFLQLVCERSDVFASACGVARAYPLYSRKTAACSSSDHNVTVEVILVGSGDSPLSEDDIRVSCVLRSTKNCNSIQDSNSTGDVLLLLLLVSFFIHLLFFFSFSFFSPSSLCSSNFAYSHIRIRFLTFKLNRKFE